MATLATIQNANAVSIESSEPSRLPSVSICLQIGYVGRPEECKSCTAVIAMAIRPSGRPPILRSRNSVSPSLLSFHSSSRRLSRAEGPDSSLKLSEWKIHNGSQRIRVQARIEFTWAVANNRVLPSREVTLGLSMSAHEQFLTRRLIHTERVHRGFSARSGLTTRFAPTPNPTTHIMVDSLAPGRRGRTSSAMGIVWT